MLANRRAKIARAKHKRVRRPSVKMALLVGGGTRSATFEIQSVFVRKESTHIRSCPVRGSIAPSMVMSFARRVPYRPPVGPWHNWLARLAGSQEVRGSNPLGSTHCRLCPEGFR